MGFKRLALYLKETRAPFFTASIIPVLFGTAMGFKDAGRIDIWLFLLTLAGVVSLHAGANVVNDYFDHTSGADWANTKFVRPFTGGSRMIQNGLLGAREVLIEGLVFYTVGSLIGIYLAYRVGMPVLWLGVFGVVTSFFYTSPPLRLVHRGIGEVVIALNFGTLVAVGTYYVQTKRLLLRPAISSLPIAILVLLILYVNEFQDLDGDREVGKLGWVARLGTRRAVWLYGVLLAAVYLIIIAAVATSYLPIYALAALFTIPMAVKAVVTAHKNYMDPKGLVPANVSTILLHLLVGGILTVSYLLPDPIF